MTDAIREVLRTQGSLDAGERDFVTLRPLNLTEAQRSDALEYRPGEIIQFHQNAKGFKRGEKVTVTSADSSGVRAERADGSRATLPLQEAARFQVYQADTVAVAKGDSLRITQNGFTRESRRGFLGAKAKSRLNNGAVYEVQGFTKEGDIQLSNGFIVPGDYGGITHGYVVTSHASQGKTVDVALVALGSESFAAASREQAYVSISRGREAVRIYTDDKASMVNAIRNSAARLSATELMGEDAKRKPNPMQRALKLHSAQRVYNALRERVFAPQAFQSQPKEGMDRVY